jgi:hypothetical protein
VELLNNVFICAPNKALIDGRLALPSASLVETEGKPIKVVCQLRFLDVRSEDPSVSVGEVAKWYTTTMKALSAYEGAFHLILLFVTNRRLTSTAASHDIALRQLFDSCPRLMIVTKAEFEHWLTPTFAHRGLILSEGRPLGLKMRVRMMRRIHPELRVICTLEILKSCNLSF